eukprot:1782213-Rhodomonas_salina.1
MRRNKRNIHALFPAAARAACIAPHQHIQDTWQQTFPVRQDTRGRNDAPSQRTSESCRAKRGDPLPLQGSSQGH